MKVLGLMSGTSMDGLDCSISDIDIDDLYNFNYKILDFKTYPFNSDLKQLIRSSLGNNNINIVKRCNEELGVFFLEKSKLFLVNRNIDLISMHGQTISHQDRVRSIQIGNPKYLYDYFNVPLCFDFRTKDIELGGCGAPLMPFLDWLLFRNNNIDIITLNIGGISNISYIPKSCFRDKVSGFDTGPGMCLIDEYVKMKFNKEFDLNGLLASKGKVHDQLLNYLLTDSFVNKDYPKSTSREYYGYKYIKKIVDKFPFISKYNLLRTLVSFTADSIVTNINNSLNINKYRLILSGGGVKNFTLYDDIKKKIGSNEMITSNNFNINSDTKESFLMTVLGVCRYKNIDNNMPSVTGAVKYDCYGEIYE